LVLEENRVVFECFVASVVSSTSALLRVYIVLHIVRDTILCDTVVTFELMRRNPLVPLVNTSLRFHMYSNSLDL
jgi:hypothetical protein